MRVARNLRTALLWGTLITAFGFLMFFVLPTRNSYIAAPGVFVAWMMNGGVHGNGLGKGFDFLFWTIAAGINVLLYSAAAWLCLMIFSALRRQDVTTS